MTRMTRIYADFSRLDAMTAQGCPVRDKMLVENAKPHVTPHPVRDAITGLDGFIPTGCRFRGNIVLSTNISSLTGCKNPRHPRHPRHPRSIFVSISVIRG